MRGRIHKRGRGRLYIDGTLDSTGWTRFGGGDTVFRIGTPFEFFDRMTLIRNISPGFTVMVPIPLPERSKWWESGPTSALY